MKFTSNKKFTSWLLCMMLIVAMAFTTVGCNSKKDGGVEENTVAVEEAVENSVEESTDAVEETVENEVEVLGEGETMFLFTVVDKDGNKVSKEIKVIVKSIVFHDCPPS